MNKVNLKTTLEALVEASPTVLDEYVKEAPKDGEVYGRQNGKWVALNSDKLLYVFDTDNSSVSFDDINKLHPILIEDKTIIPVTLNIENIEGEYCYFCSTIEIMKVMSGGLDADIEQLSSINLPNGKVLFVYRTTELLISGVWNFTVYLSPITTGK